MVEGKVISLSKGNVGRITHKTCYYTAVQLVTESIEIPTFS